MSRKSRSQLLPNKKRNISYDGIYHAVSKQLTKFSNIFSFEVSVYIRCECITISDTNFIYRNTYIYVHSYH